MRQWRDGMGLRGALGLALLLALQLAFSGMALGASASLPSLDAYGNPICATGADYAADAPVGNTHRPVPACCQIGCAMAGGAALSPPAAGGVEAPQAVPLETGTRAFAKRLGSGEDAWRPGNPRAPPATA